ncbi:MAG TPA: class I SAM-dependent methyltransferase [Chitinophagaceae bacterium]
MKKTSDTWNSGDPYEYFMGRWSKLMAPEFLKWLDLPYNLSWLDIGCGTGALSETINLRCKPARLSCIDPSADFLEKAKEKLGDKVEFAIGNASNIPEANNSVDVVVSGLALNFFPDLNSAFSEIKRVLKVKGIMAAYVWDYAGRMDFLRLFWDTVIEINPDAKNHDEGIRFPICNIDNLKKTFREAGLTEIETTFLDIYTVFKNFEDYWNPFLGGQGPAPTYLASLPGNLKNEIKSLLLKKLPAEPDGSIRLLARAIAARGFHAKGQRK